MQLLRLKTILLIFILSLTFLFSGLAIASTWGELVIGSNPPGASIYINGEYRGQTPKKIMMRSGNYTLKLLKNGFVPYHLGIRIQNSKRLKITPHLQRTPQFGMLMVRSYPPGAKIYVNNRYYDRTPTSIKLKRGNYNVRLEKDHYRPFSKTVQIRPSQDTVVTTKLEPIQRYGTLDINTYPDNSKVFINNDYYGRTPFRIRLLAGEYNIRLIHRGYVPLEKTLQVRRGAVNTKNFELQRVKPRPRIGRLKIYSFPENASVFIQNNDYGRTPVEVRLNEGNYLVEIKKKGYRPFQKNVNVSSRQVSYINANLDKKQVHRKFGKIHFSSTPRHAKVMIDGSYHGEAPLSVQVPAGEHKVRIQKKGYESFHKTVYVKPWGEHYVEAFLSASAPRVRPTAIVKIISTPLKSKVFINGIYKGKTPLKINLKPNVYALEIRHKSYLPYRQPLTVKPGQGKKNVKAKLIWAGHLPPPPHEIIEELTRNMFD